MPNYQRVKQFERKYGMNPKTCILILVTLLLASCGPSQQEIDAMIDKKVSAALTALPTETTMPTSVPQKFEMPTPAIRLSGSRIADK